MNNLNKLIALKSSNDSNKNSGKLAREAWRKYKIIIEERHPDLITASSKYFAERVDAPFVVPLNAQVPVLLAEAFGVVNEEIITAATIGNLHLDHFTQLLDDATDISGEPIASALHLSHHLLFEGVEYLVKTSLNKNKVMEKIHVYLNQTMKAERLIWSHKYQLVPYTETDLSLIGMRGGMPKCTAALYADISGNWGILPIIEKALETAALGVQLVDDLFDWQEDLRLNIYTPVLVATYQYLDVDTKSSLADHNIAQGLINSGAAESIIKRAQKDFIKSSNMLREAGAKQLACMIENLNQEANKILSFFSRIKNEGILITDAKDFNVELRKSTNTQLMH